MSTAEKYIDLRPFYFEFVRKGSIIKNTNRTIGKIITFIYQYFLLNYTQGHALWDTWMGISIMYTDGIQQ